jgi:hypothetical protein
MSETETDPRESRNPWVRDWARINNGEFPNCPKCGAEMELHQKPLYDGDQVYHPPIFECPECGKVHPPYSEGW